MKTHRLRSNLNAVCCISALQDLISGIILLVMETVYNLLSSTKCEKHGARCATSTEILRFTALRRDEGYQSLELNSDNKPEAPLLHSNAFFYVRKRYRQNYSSRNGFRDGFKKKQNTHKIGIMFCVLQSVHRCALTNA